MIFKLLSKTANILFRILGFITISKAPLIIGVNAIVQDEQGNFLVQLRADDRGYCLPGGLTKQKETLEEAIFREVFEETGIKIKDIKPIFYIDASKEFPYIVTQVFSANVQSGQIKSSWEGKAEWLNFNEIKENMAFHHDTVIKKYLKSYKD